MNIWTKIDSFLNTCTLPLSEVHASEQGAVSS